MRRPLTYFYYFSIIYLQSSSNCNCYSVHNPEAVPKLLYASVDIFELLAHRYMSVYDTILELLGTYWTLIIGLIIVLIIFIPREDAPPTQEAQMAHEGAPPTPKAQKARLHEDTTPTLKARMARLGTPLAGMVETKDGRTK